MIKFDTSSLSEVLYRVLVLVLVLVLVPVPVLMPVLTLMPVPMPVLVPLSLAQIQFFFSEKHFLSKDFNYFEKIHAIYPSSVDSALSLIRSLAIKLQFPFTLRTH